MRKAYMSVCYWAGLWAPGTQAHRDLLEQNVPQNCPHEGQKKKKEYLFVVHKLPYTCMWVSSGFPASENFQHKKQEMHAYQVR